MRQRVLLAAAALDVRARFARQLQASGYAVELASDEKRALRLAHNNHYQVAIVASDSSPPGLELMRELRDAVPKMIVLAEGSSDIDRLRRSLPAVDEFLLTSSSEGALTARVGELIARTNSTACESRPAPGMLSIEDCRLDLTGCVFVDAVGREVTLTRAETNFLKELAASPCQVVSRDQLGRAVAGRDPDPFDRSVDMLVARLRRKIEPDRKVPRLLVTVPGVGYKLMARPRCAEVGQSGLKLNEPERRQVTALSCKLVGATGFAVNLDPEDLVEITQNFQDAAAEAITGMGGTIATVAPDEILAFFGYPQAHEDDAERAVNAGLDAVTKIGQLVSPKGELLQVRAAVATGLAFASPRQTLGEPSVIAQGICDLATPNSVLTTASTRRLLSATFVCESPEQYTLPGLSQSVSASRICSSYGTAPNAAKVKSALYVASRVLANRIFASFFSSILTKTRAQPCDINALRIISIAPFIPSLGSSSMRWASSRWIRQRPSSRNWRTRCPRPSQLLKRMFPYMLRYCLLRRPRSSHR
jgi:DNA-binding response OmpR family regulator